jgi:hypothetical protein
VTLSPPRRSFLGVLAGLSERDYAADLRFRVTKPSECFDCTFLVSTGYFCFTEHF